MSDPGDLDRDSVIAVLRAQGVTVSPCGDDPKGETFTLAKGSRIESQKFPKKVRRPMLHYLAHHYSIPVHYFFHPDMMPPQQLGNPSLDPKKVQ